VGSQFATFATLNKSARSQSNKGLASLFRRNMSGKYYLFRVTIDHQNKERFQCRAEHNATSQVSLSSLAPHRLFLIDLGQSVEFSLFVISKSLEVQHARTSVLSEFSE
jgi:hypothetical protein